jgi:hypothetical protein
MGIIEHIRAALHNRMMTHQLMGGLGKEYDGWLSMDDIDNVLHSVEKHYIR